MYLHPFGKDVPFAYVFTWLKVHEQWIKPSLFGLHWRFFLFTVTPTVLQSTLRIMVLSNQVFHGPTIEFSLLIFEKYHLQASGFVAIFTAFTERTVFFVAIDRARFNVSHEKKPSWLGYIGDYTIPSYIGIITNHYKDPYQPTSISWKVGPGFFRGSCDFFNRKFCWMTPAINKPRGTCRNN